MALQFLFLKVAFLMGPVSCHFFHPGFSTLRDQLTLLAGKWGPRNEDVCPIKNGDVIPAIAM